MALAASAHGGKIFAAETCTDSYASTKIFSSLESPNTPLLLDKIEVYYDNISLK